MIFNYLNHCIYCLIYGFTIIYLNITIFLLLKNYIMKQRYLLWIILCAPFILTWCFDIMDWDWMENNVEKPVQIEEVKEDNNQQELKQSLTLEDFEYLNENLVPKSYHYKNEVIRTKEIRSEWDYEFKDWDKVLIPSRTVKTEIISSELFDDILIETQVKFTLDDGQEMIVHYFNDPIDLKFFSAYVIQGQINTQYDFNY